MVNLLKFEFRNLLRNKAIYICGVIVIAFIALSIFTTWKIEKSFNIGASEDDSIIIEEDDTDYTGRSLLMSALGDSGLPTIIAIFVTIFICNDFTEGTIKHIISKGNSRASVYCSKFLASFVAITVISILSMLTAFVMGSVLWKVGATVTMHQIVVLLVQMLCIYSYFTIFFVFSFLIRKKSTAIAIGIVFPMIISIVLSIADTMIKNKNTTLPSDLWIPNILSNISSEVVKNTTLIQASITAITYFILFFALGYIASRKIEY